MDFIDGNSKVGNVRAFTVDDLLAENKQMRDAINFALDVIPGDVGSSKTDEALERLEAAITRQ